MVTGRGSTPPAGRMLSAPKILRHAREASVSRPARPLLGGVCTPPETGLWAKRIPKTLRFGKIALHPTPGVLYAADRATVT